MVNVYMNTGLWAKVTKRKTYTIKNQFHFVTI